MFNAKNLHHVIVEQTTTQLCCADEVNPRTKKVEYPVIIIPDSSYSQGKSSIIAWTPKGLMEISLCELCYETIICHYMLLQNKQSDRNAGCLPENLI